MDYRTKMEMVRRARMGGDEMEPESRRRRDRKGRYMRGEYEPDMYGTYDAYDAYDRYEEPENYRRTEYRERRMAYEPTGHHMMEEHPMRPEMGRIGFAKKQGVLTWEMAQEWVHNLKAKSGKGQKWEFDHIKKLMEQQKIKEDPIEFWAVINALHSDYGEVLRKYGVNTLDAYIDMAKAWLDDEDAVEDKALTYFECIVK